MAYASVVAMAMPDKTPDLLGYGMLIAYAASHSGNSPGWKEYDEMFRARADLHSKWSDINHTMWAVSVNKPRAARPNVLSAQSQAPPTARPSASVAAAPPTSLRNAWNPATKGQAYYRDQVSRK